MKKTLAILSCLLILISCAALTGCGKQDLTNSKYLGTWIATRATLNDQEYPLNEVISGGMTMKLNPDGTAVVSAEAKDNSCTWKETGKGIKVSGDMKMNLKAEGEELVMNSQDKLLHFEKMTETAEALNDLGNAIGGVVSGAVSNAVSGAAEVADSVTNNTTVADTASAANDGTGTTGSVAGNAVSAANDVASDAVSAANDVANGAVSAANDVASAANEAASNVVDGLVSGIASLTGSTASAQ